MGKILHLFEEFQTPIIIVFIILMSFLSSRLFQWMLNKGINQVSDKMNIDPTRYRFFKNALNLIIAFCAIILIIYTIPSLKTLAVGLFAGAGVLLAIVGFASQHAFANIVNGIFIVISKPFRVGDMIKVGEREYGIVEDITLRHTVIRDFKNRSIVIPNSIISSETILNDTFNDTIVCRWIEIGISYDSNIEKAISIIQEEAGKHPKCIDHRTAEEIEIGDPKVTVRVIDFGEYSVKLRAYVWTDDALNAIQMHSDLNISIKKRFNAEGIEMPYPYKTIVYKKDLPKNSN